jgi:hypothetical protein
MLLSCQSEQGLRTQANRRKSKRYKTDENADPLPSLHTATAVRDAVARLIADVYTRKVHPKIAAGMVLSCPCSCRRSRPRIWSEDS